MKNRLTVVVMGLCIVLSLVACQKKTPPPDSGLALEQEEANRIYALLFDFTKARNAHDSGQIMAFYADDAVITSLDGQTWTKAEQAERMKKVVKMMQQHDVIQNVSAVRDIVVKDDKATAVMEVDVYIAGHVQPRLVYDLELAKRHGDWYLTKSTTKKL
ncbi:DUF4440 domain-containing protein [Desulfovibrio inopinatus]|uniref:DUF4440 domain-containing protein n=1 Tax=Desulfovibrio inopinatus TaxID=102109 RepID=UPI00040E05C0|nr:DUF4440 domain-containing protein [Desulfovibrio inopinatus]